MGELLESFIADFMTFFPKFIVALLIFVLGWFISLAAGKIFAGILYRLKFNSFFTGEKWEKAMQKAEIRINPSDFLGDIIKWTIFIFIIWLTVGVLGLHQFSNFMQDVVNYLPNVIIATLIFIVAVMISEFFAKMVIATTEKSEFPYPKSAGMIVKMAIWVFAGFAILVQLGIAEQLLLTVFQGIIAFLVIAGGLSFGLGGEDAAKQFIGKIKKMIK